MTKIYKFQIQFYRFQIFYKSNFYLFLYQYYKFKNANRSNCLSLSTLLLFMISFKINIIKHWIKKCVMIEINIYYICLRLLNKLPIN